MDKLRGWLQLIPTPVQMVGFGLTSLAILVGTNVDLILGRLAIQDLPLAAAATDLYTQFLDRLSAIPSISTMVLVVFWGSIALIVNTFIWGVRNTIAEAENEVILETQYTNQGTRWQRLKPVVLQLALALSLVLLLLVTATRLLPFWLTDFRLSWVYYAGLVDSVRMVGVWLGLTANLLMLWKLFKSVLLAS